MPRSEANNPTVRMGRVLDAFDELEAVYDQTISMVAAMLPQELFSALPPKPAAEAIVAERTRRQLTGGKVEYKRNYMRKVRSTQPEAQVIRGLTPEDEAAILKELDEFREIDTTPEPDGSVPPHKGT